MMPLDIGGEARDFPLASCHLAIESHVENSFLRCERGRDPL